MKNFMSILNESKAEMINEAGIRLPPTAQSFKILHHDDADGLGSAKMIRKQLHNQLFKKFKKKNPGKTDKQIYKIIDSRIVYKDVTDGSTQQHVEKALQKSANQVIIVVDFDRFEKFGPKVAALIKNGAINFHSDHHETETPRSTGGGKTGATDFRSDTEHLATKIVSKGVDAKAVLAFSDTDSATFKEKLSSALGLKPSAKKEFKIINGLFIYLSQFARGPMKSPVASKLFIKNSGDSLMSMYTYSKKLAAAINLANKGQNALNRKKEPSQKEADEIRKQLIKSGFRELAMEVKKGNKSKFLNSPEKLKEKNVKDFEDKELYFKKAGKYIVLSELSGAKQPSRYLGFTVPNDDPDVKKYFSMIRSWNGMGFFQMSLSPEAPKEVKDAINLVEIMKESLTKVRAKFENKYNTWAFNIIDEEMGGHAGITNAGGMGLFGLMPKKMREEYKAIVPISKRVKALSVMKRKAPREEFLKKVPGLAAKLGRLKELEDAKKEYSKNKVKVMNYFKKIMAEEVDKKIAEVMKKKPTNEATITLKQKILENTRKY